MSFSGKQYQTPKKTISNQSFWPDLELADFINDCRVPADLPEATVKAHLIDAMIDVNTRLDKYRNEQTAAGYKKLEDVPSEKINIQSIQVSLYVRAVFCHGKASVLRDFPAVDRRSASENQAKSSEETEDQYLQYADEAINRFLKMCAINVELI